MSCVDCVKIKIYKNINLCLIYPLCYSSDVASLMQKMNDVLVADEEYVDGLDVIVMYQDTVFPDNAVYFNDLDMQLNLTGRANRFIDIFHKDDNQLVEFSKIFNLFAVNNRDFAKKVIYKFNVKDAVAELELDEHLEKIEAFFSTLPNEHDDFTV